MTAHGIAQRLLAKYDQQQAIHRIETRIDGLRLYWGTGLTSHAEAAKLGAYLMLWSAVRYHLDLGPA